MPIFGNRNEMKRNKILGNFGCLLCFFISLSLPSEKSFFHWFVFSFVTSSYCVIFGKTDTYMNEKTKKVWPSLQYLCPRRMRTKGLHVPTYTTIMRECNKWTNRFEFSRSSKEKKKSNTNIESVRSGMNIAGLSTTN